MASDDAVSVAPVPRTMKARVHLISAYLGYVYMGCMFVALVSAHFIPPPAPSLGPEEIAQFFREHTTGIRVGMFIGSGGAALLLFWNGALSAQLKRIEGGSSALVYANVAAGACLVLEFIFPMMWWANAAFRPEGNPEIIQRLNDLAWLPFLGVVSTAVAQAVIMAVLTLQDRSEQPVFPRWFAYFNLFLAGTFWTGPMIFFFKDGPFAWNGAISFWMLVTTFTAWMVGVTAMLVRAVKRDHTLTDAPPALTSVRPAAVEGLQAQIDDLRAEVASLRTQQLPT